LKVAPSLARVEADKVSGGLAFGTAVVIAPERVITNCHVTREAKAISLVRGGSRWSARAQLSDVDHDLCLLWVPGLEGSPVLMASSAGLYVGQPVTAIGYGGANGIQHVNGDVTALHLYEGSRVIQSSAAFSGGASGGGLFDENGNLVGILTFRLPAKGAYYFSMPVEWFRNLVFDLSRYRAVAPLGEMRSFWEQPEGRQPFFMRATALEAEQNWSELLRMSETWSVVEPDNPDSGAFRDKAIRAQQ
jgi:S1-C subfamily serine protease